MHDVVYDVYGGFEDWVYGASWEPSYLVNSCKNYSKEIKYEDHSHRSFVYLVEAGFQKIPSENTLGNEIDVF
jgi:hypothetical protein